MEHKNRLHNSSSRLQNPFVPGQPVRGDDFFGRKDVIDHVIRFLHKKHEAIILIYGQRRIGKTSLLKKIEKEILEAELACPVYFNLQDQYYKPFPQFLYNMAKAVQYSLALNLEVKEEDFTGADTPVSHYFQEDFVPGVIRELPVDRPLLFLFDEADVMVPREEKDNAIPNVDAGRNFVSFIANWLEEIQYKKYPLKFILAVGREYKDPAQKQFDRLAKYGTQLETWYFTREETRQLIKMLSDPVIPFEEDAINGIYDLTSGHPFFTQCLASHSFNAAQKANRSRVNLDMVKQQVPAAIKSYSAGIYWIWDTLPLVDQAILYLAAVLKEENKPVNMKTLTGKAAAHHMEITAVDLSQALDRLIANKFIQETHHKEKQYDFYIEFFRQWIVNKFSRSDFFLEKKHLV